MSIKYKDSQQVAETFHRLHYAPTDYVALLKLKQTTLLLFTSIAAYFAAPGKFNIYIFLLLVLSEFFAIGGTTAVNMYFDRDIDAKMKRTKIRPLPAGRVNPENVLKYGIGIFIIGLLVSFFVNCLLSLTILLGFIFDIFVYTLYFKRRTSLNIIFGGIAGGMPAMGGWLAKTGFFEFGALLTFSLVFLWIPMHIWFLSIYYLEDYKRAGIPMLPVVKGERETVKFVILALFLLEMVVITMYILKYANIFTLAISTILAFLSIRVMAKFVKNPNKKIARHLFKFANPYLALIFTSIMVEKLLNIP
jgi:protoheme IX farnesyltransferase